MKILLFSTHVQRAISFANAPLNLWLFSKLSKLIYSLSFGLSALSAQAQIMPDGTLSSTVSSLDGQNFIIDNGDRTGNNLFHSFDTFSVPTNGSAVFNNPTDIENIFSRVTGPNLSNIDGLLQANGTTNLFLLNPNGIFFGENASLNIGGSFVASTAERILFSDTVEFSAVNGAPAPLLTVSTPVGLGFGTNPKPITVAGPGHNMLLNFSTSIPIQNNRPVGLQVDAGETLALVGGDILVEGGNLTANQGRIELGSVAQSGTVSLTPVADGLTFDYDVIGLGDIRFTQSASVDVSGEGGGNLSFQAGSLAVLNGSAIISNVLGDDDGGEIIIRASDSLEIRGTPFGSFPTGFFNQGEVNSTGQVGEMIFDVGMLIIDNAQIRSTAMGQGDGGSLIIQANDVDLSGFSTDIVVETGLGSEGDGGDINLQVAETLRVTNFAELGSRTLGQGNGGSVDIQAKNIELSGFSTNIFAETGLGTEGDGGDINLQVAETLRVTNFSDISTRTLGQGNGGSVDIQANDIELSGSGSGIFSETSLESEGDAGDISLQIVDRLQVTESAKIRSTTFGIGDGGSLDIQASNIELRGSGSDILTRTDSRAEGNAGSIDLQVANRLQVTERAEINSTTLGSGDGGSIDIESSDIEVSNRAGIFAETRSDTEGNAGRIDLQVVETLQVTEGAEISNASFGPGNGAPIVIRANDIELSGFFSGISAETASDVGGDAGNIDLQVVETLLILDDAEISNTTFGQGNGGSIVIRANNIELSGFSTGILAEARSRAEGNAGNIDLQVVETLRATDGAEISNNNSGQGNGGTIDIRANDIELSGSFSGISSEIRSGAESNAGSIDLKAKETLRVTDGAQISSTTLGQADGGSLDIQASNIDLSGLSTGIFAETSSRAEGNAGSINLQVETLQATEDAQISSTTLSQGNGGSIDIRGNRLQLETGAQISSAVFRQGDGGSLAIQSSDITLTGVSKFTTRRSGITTSTQSGSEGNAGSINLDVDTLQVTEGAEISSATSGRGDGNTLTIQADSIEVSGVASSDQVLSSGIVASAEPGSEGSAGSIAITAEELRVRDQGHISVSDLGMGDASEFNIVANLNIAADRIFLTDGGKLTAEVAAGDEGNIVLLADDFLIMRRGALVSANAINLATGGNVTIEAPVILGLENSDIVANAVQGDGGRINITTQAILGLEFRSVRTPESDITASSQFGVDGIVQLDTPDLDPSQGLIELPGELADPSNQIATGCLVAADNSLTLSGRSGLPDSPEEPNGAAVWEDWRPLETETRLATLPASIEIAPLVEATEMLTAANGQVEFVAQSETLSSPHQMGCRGEMR